LHLEAPFDRNGQAPGAGARFRPLDKYRALVAALYDGTGTAARVIIAYEQPNGSSHASEPRSRKGHESVDHTFDDGLVEPQCIQNLIQQPHEVVFGVVLRLSGNGSRSPNHAAALLGNEAKWILKHVDHIVLHQKSLEFVHGQ